MVIYEYIDQKIIILIIYFTIVHNYFIDYNNDQKDFIQKKLHKENYELNDIKNEHYVQTI